MAPFPPLPPSLLPPAAAALISELLKPTKTLFLRQTQTTPSATDPTVTLVTNTDSGNNNALTGGAIAGIVIGSIAGFLLLVWIVRSCTNLGAPPGDEAVPGQPWYGSVKDEDRVPAGYRRRGRSRHSRHHRHHHHHGGSASRSRSRRASVVVPVQEVRPAVVRDGGRGRSYSARREEGGYYYGDGAVRTSSRSRSRGNY